MISLMPLGKSGLRRINRRDVLRLGSLAAMGFGLPMRDAVTATEITVRQTVTARNCIYIFLCGGPSQLDMWDPKPNAPDQIRGLIRPIATNVPGIQIGELLPQVARHADKLALIRSMHHDSTSHDIGILYTLLADTTPPTKRAYPPGRSDHPGLGAILRALLGNTPDMPAWVTIPRPFTTGSRFYKGQSAGFLGPAYDPFFLNEEKRDSLIDKEFQIQSLRPAEAVNQQRFNGRRSLLSRLDSITEGSLQSAQTDSIREYYEKAFSMLSSEGAQRAFDLSREPNKLRDRYGRNEYGQSFLLARRLVEAGVRMVNIFWTYYGPDG